MKRHLYDADHEAFRTTVAAFVDREVKPHLERWEDQRLIDRSCWEAAGRQGILGLSVPEEYGGAGLTDYRFRNVIQEEFAGCYAASLASSFSLQDDIAVPYLVELGTDAQKERWLPAMAAGTRIGAIAMTEPGTGSDLQGIRTAARRVDGGWVVNGSKTFITNGIQSDLIITVVRTDPDGGPQGFSLMAVERQDKGFSRGRKLSKIGLHAQDTAELVFEDVFVPDEHVLGNIGGGFGQLKRLLPLERLSIAAHAVASADVVLRDTVTYVRERTAFGRPIADFQNTRFELAEMTTEVAVTRSYVDDCIRAHAAGELTEVDAAQAKWWSTDVQNRVIDRCLQLYGGYGYMLEYPVARAFQDARIQKIFGGTNEIMKHIIGRSVVSSR
ncbi:acyl-CoA dehydrogenase family protein [Aeromicrobium panaciterrae]|uniref:acyl-CoA dehydrogenase family protein n=1 Tax=Aeromicrobium panaciterrae TaxID=363861 RepID=UPI0031E070F2